MSVIGSRYCDARVRGQRSDGTSQNDAIGPERTFGTYGDETGDPVILSGGEFDPIKMG